MRRLVSISVLALSLAVVAPANAADTWFRLNMGPIVFAGHGQDGGPPGGGVNDNIAINVAEKADLRVYGQLSVGVAVSGIDASYSVSVFGLPVGAIWTPNPQVYGAGTISWPSAAEGTYRPIIEVRDADSALVANAELEIVIHPALTAAVAQATYEVAVGEELVIEPTIGNAIGAIQWGSIPADLPEWLGFDASTGEIAVDTAATNTLSEIVLTAVDQADMTLASTLPFSVSVNGADTDYWFTTLGGAGSDVGQGLSIGQDGSVYVLGYTASIGAGGTDLLLAKYSPNGDLSWMETLGGTGGDIGQSLSVGPDGSVYVLGYTASAGAGANDLLLAKYSSNGDLSWKRTLGGTGSDYGYGISVNQDGSAYVVGYTGSAGAGGADFLVAKYSTTGDLAWKKTLGGAGTEIGQGISIAQDGSVYVLGETSTGAGSNDFLLAKYSASGDLAWKKTLGGTGAEVGQSLSVGLDGSVYVLGHTSSIGAGGVDLLLAKYSVSGDLAWKKALGGAWNDVGYGLSVAPDGSVYVTGYTANMNAGGNNILLAKYSVSGDLSWRRALSGAGADYGRSLSVGTDGSLYFAGYTASAGAGGFDLLVARLPSHGGADMTAGPLTWSDAALTVNPNPALTHGPNPILTENANPSLAHGSNPTLASGDGASLTSATTPFAEE